MSYPLITTKLRPPRARSQLVARPELLARLATNPERKLTLVAAPAGYGKTTLVQRWLADDERPVAWVSLDPNDNDPARCLAYVAAALNAIDPGLAGNLAAALASPQPPSPEALFAQLVNDIAAASVPIVLVLDDWHLIDAPALTEGLAGLVTNQPPQLHLVIITREDPLLPLPRLRVRGELIEVRARDLRFNRAEAGVFLNEIQALNLGRDDVERLAARTDGWVAGLQLAAISMRSAADRRQFVTAFSGSHHFVVDYLSEEVLAHLADDVRHFLLRTAVLDRLTAPLCDAVTGRADSRQMLQRIDELNLFLIHLDDERRWFRYHHLFVELLRKKLAQTDPAAAAAGHARASRWFDAHGWTAEAIEHARAGDDRAWHAQLVERHALDHIKRGQIDLARQWIEALPPAVWRARPRLLMDYAWTRFLSGSMTPLPALMAELAQLPALPRAVAGEASALRAFISLGRPEETRRHAEHALNAVPEENLLVRGLVHTALANVQLQVGDKHGALSQFEQSIPLHWAAGNRVAAAMALLDIVMINLALGAWREAAETIAAVIARAERAGVLRDPALGIAHIAAGWVQLHRNEPRAAIDAIERGQKIALAGGSRSARYGFVALAQAHAALGQAAAVRPLLASFVDAIENLVAAQVAFVAVRAAELYLWLGDVAAAESWLARPGASQDDAYPLAQARLMLAQAVEPLNHPRLERARQILDGEVDRCTANGWRYYLIEALLLRARTHAAIGARTAARADVRRAVTIAAPLDAHFPFLRDSAAMRPLLNEIVDLPFAATLRNALRAAAPAAPAEPSVVPIDAAAELPEPLSTREAEILSLLPTGLTYRAMAERLMVSVNTIRYHIKGLYGKLAVSSRAEAIARARALGLLD